MDPFSALSIATGVVAFVDFGGKLLSLYSEIQQSDEGRPAALSALEAQSRELSANATHAREKIASLREHYPQQVECLDRLKAECALAEKELQGLVDGLPARSGRGLKAQGAQVLSAVNLFFKQGDFKRLEDRLKSIRDQTIMSTVMCTAKHVGKMRDTLHSVKQGVDNLQPGSCQGFSGTSERDTMEKALWTSIVAAEKASGPSINQVEESPIPTNDNFIEQKILEGLEFDDMTAREDQIQTPFPDTFRWLLGEGGSEGTESGSGSESDETGNSGGPSPANHRTGFKEWLESTTNDTPYWITGKPASGKSTLMKFICTNTQVKEHLRRWAGELELLTCGIYIWNPGSSRQKNQIGLLRTMLYQLLSRRPNLGRLIASNHYMYFQLAGVGASNLPDWTVDQLKDAIAGLLHAVRDTHRVAAFVDGLDEYEGDPSELIAFFTQLHRDHNIKLCFSSRPLNTFRDKFLMYPSLRMEHLTKPDIEHYVHKRIKECRAFEEIRAVDTHNIDDLELQIVDKAKGVFLWVVLVVERLVITAQDNNNIRVIWEVFESLPPELTELYEAMRRRLREPLRREASIMYQILFRWKKVLTNKPITSWVFWAAINHEDPERPPQPPSEEEITGTIPLLERRLAGCTGGMLQVTHARGGHGVVDFLHRTAFEWLQDMRDTVISDGPTGYEPGLVVASVVGSLSRSEDPELVSGLNCPTSAVYDFGRSCDNSPEVRAKLLRITDRLEGESLRYPFKRFPGYYSVGTSFDHQSDATLRWFFATKHACPQYLRARLESRSGPKSPRFHMVSRFLWTKHERDWLDGMIAAALGTSTDYDHSASFWNMKLKTLQILLEAKFAPRRVVEKAIKSGIDEGTWPRKYEEALLALVRGKGLIELTQEDIER
ncbi:hypothetical protein MAPG_01450 [Magnaporthiopsis poae ATCC 64411]|uniref:Nephrocystin 3-like N-terminal domain-containing protein n=1 Tax=Magnaporthiopsis poae (strain ATCC 64411 / 73-15) TaxID=644358 RepID=A0A0C4DNQ6_MAGP6|nr:hypothetical protein MAPG_01450 [Magnaporthiopsis poae ATCC 64411]